MKTEENYKFLVLLHSMIILISLTTFFHASILTLIISRKTKRTSQNFQQLKAHHLHRQQQQHHHILLRQNSFADDFSYFRKNFKTIFSSFYLCHHNNSIPFWIQTSSDNSIPHRVDSSEMNQLGWQCYCAPSFYLLNNEHSRASTSQKDYLDSQEPKKYHKILILFLMSCCKCGCSRFFHLDYQRLLLQLLVPPQFQTLRNIQLFLKPRCLSFHNSYRK